MAKHGDGTRRNVTNQVLFRKHTDIKMFRNSTWAEKCDYSSKTKSLQKNQQIKLYQKWMNNCLNFGYIWQNWETEQACHMDTYHGGLQCCKHSWFLTDVDQDHLIPKDKVNTQNCPWNILSVKKHRNFPIWPRWTHTTWSGATTSKSTLLPQRRNLPLINIFTTGSSS